MEWIECTACLHSDCRHCLLMYGVERRDRGNLLVETDAGFTSLCQTNSSMYSCIRTCVCACACACVCVTKYREHSCLHHVNLVINTQCTWIQSEILVIAMETAVETIRHAVQTCSPISQ